MYGSRDYRNQPWQRRISVEDETTDDLEMASCNYGAFYQRQDERSIGRYFPPRIETHEIGETNSATNPHRAGYKQDDWENKLQDMLQSSNKFQNKRRDNIRKLSKDKSHSKRHEDMEREITSDYSYLRKHEQQFNRPAGRYFARHELPSILDEDRKGEFIDRGRSSSFTHKSDATADYYGMPRVGPQKKPGSGRSSFDKWQRITNGQREIGFSNKRDEFVKSQTSISSKKTNYSGNQHEILLGADHLPEEETLVQPFKYTNNERQRKFLQSSYSSYNNNHSNFSGLEMRHPSHPFYTMHNAKKIAKQLGLILQEKRDATDENTRRLEMSQAYKGRKRKCWSKFCWSTGRHSHPLDENISKESDRRNRLGHHYLDYNTLKKKIEHQHYEIKEHTSDILNGIKAPFVFWSHDLKRIEGRYGTGVLSFFLFLRWMVYVNLLMTILVISFIVIPETIFHFQEQSLLNNTTSIFYGQTNAECRNEYCNVAYIKGSNYTTKSPADLLSFCSNNYTTSIEQKNAIVNKLQDFLQGTGWMELSAMFIGWYKPTAMRNVGFAPKYDLPIIYMVVTMSYFLLCLILMVFYTRKSIRESVLKRESHLQQYCNMIFSGWDFTIEDRKLADIKHGNILQNLRSHLAEARRLADVSQWSTKKRIKITFMRILINILVVFIWVGSGFCIYQAILVAEKGQGSSGSVALLTEYLPSIVITALNLFLPLLFNFLAKYEQYSLSFTVKITLIRCIFSQLASICVLIGTLHSLIMCEDKTECGNGIGNCKAPLCWETYVGQQIYKLTLLDFAIVFLLTFFVGYPRKVVTDRCKCKLAEFIGKEEFDIPKNVLSLVYSQSLCWLGAFYSPFLPLLSLIKYIVFFYMKKFALFVNCVPAKESYKAARSNTFFMIVSMLSYLIGLFAFVYSIATIMPSKGCGPFRMYDTAWDVVVTFINKLPPQAVATLHFIGSAGFGIPAFIILSLLFYYYLTISATYGEMAEVLKGHLIVEGRDKHFLLKKLLIILRQPEL